MVVHSRRAAVALLSLMILFACKSPTGLVGEDVYVLRAIAGDALPAVFIDHEFVTVTLLADTLILRANGTGREVQVVEVLDKSDGSLSTHSWTNNLSFARLGIRLEVAYECKDVA